MYLAALFHHQCLLQVRFELAIGGPLGEGTRVPKGCGLSTMRAFSHVRETSFLAIIPKSMPFVKAEHFIIENCPAQEPDASLMHIWEVMQQGTNHPVKRGKSGKINNLILHRIF
jgi:hypothetical protein